ncbi:hypothetical protein AGMMS4957_10360 [Bacteroidia bacterium]|nr:hypothetical protein AGMMS4957_10360 [Bacteroidia bacterium]
MQNNVSFNADFEGKGTKKHTDMIPNLAESQNFHNLKFAEKFKSGVKIFTFVVRKKRFNRLTRGKLRS